MIEIYTPWRSANATTLSIITCCAVTVSCHVSLATQFANYNHFVPTGPTTSDMVFVEGPHPDEFGLPTIDARPLPGWDHHVVASVAVGPAEPPTMDPTTLIVTIPLSDTITYVAHDELGTELGRMSMLAEGNQKLDLKAENATVDEAQQTILVRVGGELLEGKPATFSVLSTSGIYASELQVLDQDLIGPVGGHFLLPLDDDPTTSLQENILTAWNTGQIVGADLRGLITGTYVPEPEGVVTILLGWAAFTGVRRCRRRRPC